METQLGRSFNTAALRYDSYLAQMYYPPVPGDVERRISRPFQPNQPLDLDHPVAWPDEPWVGFVNIATDKFEVAYVSAVLSKCRIHEAGPLGGALDACVMDERAAKLLDSIPEGSLT